ncbi:NnrU family protein [Caenispirillum bisanense]|uniref:NnrU family protein n=1 Tax=Caenispirillum bisanense TaxID=414052 RepID=UPI0031D586CC
MTSLALACLLFLASHLVVSPSPLRPWLIGRLGQGPYLGIYSLVSLAALVWMGYAYGRAPFVPVWQPPPGMAHLALILVPLAFVLLVLSVATPNPTAGPTGKALAEGRATGIIAVTRHPMMWAFSLWAVAHLLANGDLASILLFGTVLVVAQAGMVLLDRRKAREAPEGFARLAATTSRLPFVALAQGRARTSLREIGPLRIVLGLVLAAAAVAAHPWLFGVSPLPG